MKEVGHFLDLDLKGLSPEFQNIKEERGSNCVPVYLVPVNVWKQNIIHAEKLIIIITKIHFLKIFI